MKLLELFEQSGKTAAVAFGRMNPPTIGHQKVVDAILKQEADAHFLFVSQTHKPTGKNKTRLENPLPFDVKLEFIRQAFPNIDIGDTSVGTAIGILQNLEKQGFDNVIFVCGSDRVPAFTELFNKQNGIDYDLKSIKIVSSGARDPDAEGAEGMSASKMRAAAIADDFDAFKTGLPSGLSGNAEEVFSAVRQGLEPWLEQGVTEGPTDDPSFQKMMGKIQKSTPTPMSGYVALSFASEGRSKKIKGVKHNGKPMPDVIDDPEEFLGGKIEFTPDQIEQELMSIGEKYGWDSIDPGQGQGYTEMFFDTSREYTSNNQSRLAANIVRTVNEINKFFNSINRSLQSTGLPGYTTDVWQGMGPSNNINQIEDLTQITSIAKKQGVGEDISRRGFLRGVGAAAAGVGAVNTAQAQISGEDTLPDIVAHVRFKVNGQEITKDINLGTAYKSPREAGEALDKFMKSKGIKHFEYDLERVKSKEKVDYESQ